MTDEELLAEYGKNIGEIEKRMDDFERCVDKLDIDAMKAGLLRGKVMQLLVSYREAAAVITAYQMRSGAMPDLNNPIVIAARMKANLDNILKHIGKEGK